MTGAARTPTWKDRENNKRRERRRRAIAANIFAGLRLYGGYKLPKHCDNNEVLKALCNEAGWTVHPDGTTYRKGCRPVENTNTMARSAPMSPCSSYQPSRHTSYTPSPNSSSFPSPVSSTIVADGNSLIPWLRNLSASSSSSSASSSKFTHQYFHSGSISAPVTPLLNSPTARTPRLRAGPGWAVPQYPFLPLSTPPSPVSEPKWYDGVPVPQSGHTSPTFSLVSSNPFGFRVEDLARGGAGQRGTCSPSVAAVCEEIPMAEVISNEFAFGSNVSKGVVRAWEGERIHEECGQDELELTLGTSKTRLRP